MKNSLAFFLLLLLIYSCSSTSSSLLMKDPAFNAADFFKSSVTVYPPSSVSIMTGKYSNYNESEAITKITNLVTYKLNQNSQSGVYVGTEKVPDYFRGNLFKKNKSTEFFKDTKTKYFIIIQQVLVGEDTEMETMYNPTGGSYSYSKEQTKATMYFDIWNCENETLVYSVEVSAKVNDSMMANNLTSSFESVVSEFIDSISRN